MKVVLAIVLLVIASVVKAQYKNNWDYLDQMDLDAIDALNEANYYDLDYMIPDLEDLIRRYRLEELDKVKFVRAVRFCLYDYVYDRSTVEEFMYRIVYKWGNVKKPIPATKSAPWPEDKKAPVAETYPSDGRYPTPGVQSSRIKGDTYVQTGMIGGEGGDVVNSVSSGIVQSGGGINGVVSVVDGTNNQGVWRQ